MALLIWDASGLAKRYTEEAGYETVDAVFAQASSHTMATTPWGYVETYSLLLRRYNQGVLDLSAFTASATALRTEVLDNPDFGMFSIDDETIFSCISTIQKHNLNSTDAAILTALLRRLPSPPPADCVLIASDKRLLRAAAAEGLKTLNPELLPATDVPAFLAGL